VNYRRDSRSLFSPLGTERGAAFATALVVLLVLSLLGTVLLIAARKEVGISLRGKQANQAFHIADAGIEYGLNQLVQSNGAWRGPVAQDLASADSTEIIGSFTVAATLDPDSLDGGLAKYTLESTGTVTGSNAIRRLTTKVEQTTPIWNYILFLNDKTTTEYDFISYRQSMGTYYSDETTGSVHSNDDLYVYSIANGYPRFNGQITYVNKYVLGGSGTPYYSPSLPEMVAAIQFPVPDYVLLRSRASEAGNLGSYLGDVSVKLIEGTSANNDGMIEIVTTGTQTKGLGLKENVLYVENGNVYVQGTLDGRLTIVARGSSAGDVYVVDNVRYADTNLATSDDMLGLIAENDIEIYEPGGTPWGKGPHTAWKGRTAAYDKVYVDAVMFAQSGHISYQGAASWERELLFVNGALIQNKDTAIISKGTMGGGGMGGKTGYLKRYNYDKRLTYTQPPYFFKPDSSRYRISSWGEGS